jgi:hypothetical protein
MAVDKVKEYFSSPAQKGEVNFSITIDGKKQAFKDLSQERVRLFREYAIPTIEIDLDDDSTLDEIINLFVDINTYGKKVKRFDIVKAIGRENPLLSSLFKLVAQVVKKKKDKHFKRKSTTFTRVLDKLQTIQSAADGNQKVDRMWERLVEIALFARNNTHRQPGQILKAFIKTDDENDLAAIKPPEMKRLNTCFTFLDKCYKETALGDSRLATDLPYFYTMVTSLLDSDLLKANAAPPDFPAVRARLLKFSKLLVDGVKPPVTVAAALAEYKKSAERQTTHPSQRKLRQIKFLEIMDKL